MITEDCDRDQLLRKEAIRRGSSGRISQTVTEAILSRNSARVFAKNKTIPHDVLLQMLRLARFAPSGGNLQPWHVHVLTGRKLDSLRHEVYKKTLENPAGEGSEYHIYPPGLTDPYRTRRRKCGKDLYGSLGIGRGDVQKKLQQVRQNFLFYGAPVGLVVTVDKQMNQPQFVDLGLFLGHLCLLGRERGIDSCLQEAWALWPKTIREQLGVPDNHLVFCGVALGYKPRNLPSPQKELNDLATERANLGEFVTFHIDSSTSNGQNNGQRRALAPAGKARL